MYITNYSLHILVKMKHEKKMSVLISISWKKEKRYKQHCTLNPEQLGNKLYGRPNPNVG